MDVSQVIDGNKYLDEWLMQEHVGRIADPSHNIGSRADISLPVAVRAITGIEHREASSPELSCDPVRPVVGGRRGQESCRRARPLQGEVRTSAAALELAQHSTGPAPRWQGTKAAGPTHGERVGRPKAR